MSVTTSNWRNNSGELDVFEAARYFSGGGNEIPFSAGTTRENKQHSVRSGARMSLDMPLPMMKHAILTQKQMKEKYKHPSSPGGKLASFLNSLFNQTNSKKKNKKSKPVDLVEEEEEEGSRRRRRSSIGGHFNITSNISKSSTSGFRTPPPPPPPYADTPNKTVISLPKKHTTMKNDQNHDQLYIQNFRFEESEKKEFRRFSDADSDSSSDLFDLPNHDLDFYPTGLPLYETTHMDKIKIGQQIYTN